MWPVTANVDAPDGVTRDHPGYVETTSGGELMRALAGGQSARFLQKRERIRVVCQPCRRLLDRLARPPAHHDGVYRCDRCGRSYPIMVERMRREFLRAHRDGSRTIELPLV